MKDDDAKATPAPLLLLAVWWWFFIASLYVLCDLLGRGPHAPPPLQAGFSVSGCVTLVGMLVKRNRRGATIPSWLVPGARFMFVGFFSSIDKYTVLSVSRSRRRIIVETSVPITILSRPFSWTCGAWPLDESGNHRGDGDTGR